MRSRVAALCSLAFAFSIATVAAAQPGPLFQFLEKPGPHAVGLKVVEQYDYSRVYRPATDELGKPYSGERARPLETLIWYPAESASGKPMTVRDYSNLQAAETDFDHPALSEHAQQWQRAMTPTLSMPLWAVRDAPLLSGKFPLVIYAPSFTAAAWENADLCEYLASHGYVVIASADMGVSTRNMTSDVAGINAQAGDISFLIGYAKSLPDADLSEIAVAGFSWGGISNLFAAARDSRIEALVSLDGSARYYAGLVKQADVHPEQMTIPLLFFTQGEFTFEDRERYLSNKDSSDGPSVLNAWTHGDLITVHMLGMMHVEFSSMYQRNEDIWKDTSELKADYGREDGPPGYQWVARYTLAFLDAYLKHDAAAIAFLKKTPAENGVPKHFMAVDYRPGKGTPLTLEAFRAELGRQGFDHTGQVFAAMQKEKPGFKLDEGAMNDWGGSLIADHHLSEGTEILKLNVAMYPDSSNAYESLGEAYAESGEKDKAIENYKKALEKNPDNANAKKRLEELQHGTAAAK